MLYSPQTSDRIQWRDADRSRRAPGRSARAGRPEPTPTRARSQSRAHPTSGGAGDRRSCSVIAFVRVSIRRTTSQSATQTSELVGGAAAPRRTTAPESSRRPSWSAGSIRTTDLRARNADPHAARRRGDSRRAAALRIRSHRDRSRRRDSSTGSTRTTEPLGAFSVPQRSATQTASGCTASPSGATRNCVGVPSRIVATSGSSRGRRDGRSRSSPSPSSTQTRSVAEAEARRPVEEIQSPVADRESSRRQQFVAGVDARDACVSRFATQTAPAPTAIPPRGERESWRRRPAGRQWLGPRIRAARSAGPCGNGTRSGGTARSRRFVQRCPRSRQTRLPAMTAATAPDAQRTGVRFGRGPSTRTPVRCRPRLR